MPVRVSDYCSNSARVRPGPRFGIEVEAEGLPVDNVMDWEWSPTYQRHWRTVSDGSLRNGGIEFISRPLTRSTVPSAVEALWQYFREGRMHGSVRTGIHIHCNCIGMDTDQVLRILLHYALLEPQLFKYVGGQREENIYCIPWYRAHDEPESVGDWLRGSFGSARSPCKYSALFAGPLVTFGTIEFRHAPTWHDSVSMLRWYQLVNAVYSTHETTYDVLAEWNRLGPHGFARSILPFDWLEPATSEEYEDADVEMVASLLLPSRPVVAPFWGSAPELRASGRVEPSVSLSDRLVERASTVNVEDLMREYVTAPARTIRVRMPTPEWADLPPEFAEDPPELENEDEIMFEDEGPEYAPEDDERNDPFNERA